MCTYVYIYIYYKYLSVYNLWYLRLGMGGSSHSKLARKWKKKCQIIISACFKLLNPQKVRKIQRPRITVSSKIFPAPVRYHCAVRG